MKFPITRESLQAFDQKKEDAEKKEQYFHRVLEADVTSICNEVAKGMSSYSREKKFVCRNFSQHRTREAGINIDYYLPRLIERLKETFIGCDVIIDPLKTYIIIDWS